MVRAIWKGVITLGLINVPVKLFTAVRERTIRFRMLHDADLVPVQQKMVSEKSGREVEPEDRAKGFEISKDQYVLLSDEEVESVKAQASREISIDTFVDAGAIEPIYYQRTYYLGPDKGGEKGYRLFAEALAGSKKIAIARFVMRGKEYLGAIREKEGHLLLETMHWGEEVESPGELPIPAKIKTTDRELKMAQGLIDSLSARFDPEQYHDDYTDRVMEMIEKKAAGEEPAPPPKYPRLATAEVDLTEMLKASLEQAKSRGKKRPA